MDQYRPQELTIEGNLIATNKRDTIYLGLLETHERDFERYY